MNITVNVKQKVYIICDRSHFKVWKQCWNSYMWWLGETWGL